MRLYSRKNASISLRTSIHSTETALATIWRVRVARVSGGAK
jgi:hypothetical protein